MSEDTHFVHKAWADASDTIKKIQYPMLGDPAGKLAREFGVLDEEAGQAFRGTFIPVSYTHLETYAPDWKCRDSAEGIYECAEAG